MLDRDIYHDKCHIYEVEGDFHKTKTNKEDKTYLLICTDKEGTQHVFKREISHNFTIVNPGDHKKMFEKYGYQA